MFSRKHFIIIQIIRISGRIDTNEQERFHITVDVGDDHYDTRFSKNFCYRNTGKSRQLLTILPARRQAQHKN